MVDRWHWIAVDRTGKVHHGSQPSLDRVIRATEKYPIRAYAQDREAIMSRRPALLKEVQDGRQEV